LHNHEAQVNLSQHCSIAKKIFGIKKLVPKCSFYKRKQLCRQVKKHWRLYVRTGDHLYRIVSPIAEQLTKWILNLARLHSRVTSGIRIVNADVLKVKADVPESYAGSVGTGNEVILVPDANDSLTTKVTFAAKAIDPTSRSFAVEIKLPERKTYALT
jgi:membrane fusion protein (multidrug efflux system)